MRGRSGVFAAFTMVFQFSINMLVPIFLCTLLGVWIGEKTGADWVAVVLFFVGALAGGRNIYIQAKKIYEDPRDKKRNRSQEEIKETK